MRIWLWGSVFGILAAFGAQASVVVNVQKVGADTVIHYSGTVDTSGLQSSGDVFDYALSGLTGTAPGFAIQHVSSYRHITGLAAVTTDWLVAAPGFVAATSAFGDPFGLRVYGGGTAALDLASSYVSGTPLDGQLWFANTSFDALGFAAGTYSDAVTWGQGVNADSISVQVGPLGAQQISPVPLAAGFPYMFLGVSIFAGFAHRKRHPSKPRPLACVKG